MKFMNDEIIQENALSKDPFQEKTVQNYCRDIEEKIRLAASESEARTIIETACRAFESECESTVVRLSLRNHLTGLWKKYWRPAGLV